MVLLAVSFGLAAFLYLTSRQENNLEGLSLAKPTEVVSLKNGDSYTLTATAVKKEIAGSTVRMLAYNGSIPGPTIKVDKGSEVTINFENKTDIETTLHSHGVRVENQFDGVPDVTQKLIPVGGSFTYKLKFTDEGVYWYHPHFREDYTQELGLYGNYLVTPTTKDYWAEVDREETLVLDDILMENGQIASFSRTNVDHTLMGRFGNTMLVNGDDKYKLAVKQGERVRLYLTNAANTRVFNFSIPNVRMKLVGADSGKYERETWVDSVVLGPSERSIIEVWFDQVGDYNLLHKTPDKTYTLGTITVEKRPVITSYLLVPRTNQDVIAQIDPLRSMFAKKIDKSLNLTVDMMGMGSMNQGGQMMMPDGTMMDSSEMSTASDTDKIEWEDSMTEMNKMSNKDNITWKFTDTETKKENSQIDWKFRVGEKVKVQIFNDPNSSHPMQHPIHIHGQRFLVLSTNGVANTNLVFKDTVLVQKGDTVEILVDMQTKGKWAIHCHIPEHMEAGMMFNMEVN